MAAVKKSTLIFGLAVVLAMSSVSTAWADTESPDDDAIFASFAGAFAATFSISATSSLLPYATTTTALFNALGSTTRAAESYVKHNAVALQHDIYVGGGEAARDLGRIYGIAEGQIDSFGRLLYKNRTRLAPLIEPGEVDAAAAREFSDIIIEEMLDEVVLAHHHR